MRFLLINTWLNALQQKMQSSGLIPGNRTEVKNCPSPGQAMLRKTLFCLSIFASFGALTDSLLAQPLVFSLDNCIDLAQEQGPEAKMARQT
ncbi:MAG: hypothetical protein K9N34_03915, partial [Candidatus Marinimicrobia bacterium]|nr:hypothetical protein [Candidatus Neomarinimicrobiota bacterium]MCF7839796.1 hypothetical protein [Candidatus Neomarinimicrobiota bacterium]